MNIAHTLIRSIARAFYSVEHVLIIDALVLHSALRDDDLALLMGTQTKYLRKLCSKLREDGLIAVHSRSETREGAQRPFSRDYYFINYHKAIDVVKFRLKRMGRDIEARFGQTADEKKEYGCPRCGNEYTQMEVLDTIGPMGEFECKRCSHELRLLDAEASRKGGTGGHEVQSRLNAQLAPFESLMRQIDAAVVPENDFEAALANALPVQRDEAINPAAKTEPVFGRGSGNLPAATVKGLKTGPEKITISLLDDSQLTKDEQAAEAERKAKLAASNALPAWYTQSTITGEATGLGAGQEAAIGVQTLNGADTKADFADDEKKVDKLKDNSVMDAYFAELRKEQEADAKRARQEEDEDEGDEEEEEEDEFEDVGGLQRKASTPPAAKRVRIEEPVVEAISLAQNAPPAANGEEKAAEESEEEDEFEDAL